MRYDGVLSMSPKLTNKLLKDLLPRVMGEVERKRGDRPDLIVRYWEAVADEKWQGMTEACSFEKGALVVKVKNQALYAVLVQQEKERLLKKMKEKFPQVKNMIFRIG